MKPHRHTDSISALPARFAMTLLVFAVHCAYAAPADIVIDPETGAPIAVVEVRSTLTPAAKGAPSHVSLDARSAQSSVDNDFIRNYTSPVSDFSQVTQMTPGLFTYSPNGVGLGDAKTTFRGLSDGNYNILFDGIPFQDTNGVSHHSWVFFPALFLGGAEVDRSPGTAATIGQATFNGTINLLSRPLEKERRDTASVTYGSWNTQMYSYEHETGQFGANANQNLLFNVQDVKSDGYQTFNQQKRGAASVKYQNALTQDTTITAFASYLNLRTNTPSIKGPTRAQIAQFGDDYLLSGNPNDANYFGYNFYNITTDFEYLGVVSNLGNGWTLDDKAYTYRYWNKQNYNGTKLPTSLANTTANQTGVDKLNSYRTRGNLLRVSNENTYGTLRTGLWSDYASSFRYQFPTNPLNWVDAAVPNFSETYQTSTLQPFVEFEFKIGQDLKITPGIKYAYYHQHFNHLADNGGAVGNLGGKPNLTNSVTYHDTLPSLDVHYMLRPNWSLYAQYGTGDLAPPTSIYDVPNAKVTQEPKSQYSKTYQVGTVWQGGAYSVGGDVYYTKLDGAYSSSTDLFGNTTWFLNSSEVTKGIEVEGNAALGYGFSVYANATYGSAKYGTGEWVDSAPKDTETLGLNYKDNGAAVGLLVKRVSHTYSDNGAVHQAFDIAPVTVVNLFGNYTFDTPNSFTKKVKLQLGLNNLLDKHTITSVAKGGTATSSSLHPSQLDQLLLLPARSYTATLSMDF